MPTGRRGNEYAPVSVVTDTSGWISAGPSTVTVTPGSTAPEASVTRP